jgi:pantothenate kinase type III
VAGALTVLDVGNSAIKAVRFGADGGVERAERIGPPLPESPGALAALLAPFPPPFAAVSVRDGGLALLRSVLGDALPVVGSDLPVPVENRTERPAETGVDRLCAALAAHRLARGAALVAGAGTAVTVDAVDAGGAFLGGAIAPGLRAAAAGLAGAAPRLPAPDLAAGPVPLPGRTTAAALRGGFLAGFAGLVDRLAEEARAGGGLPPGAPLLLHGGDAPLLLPLLRTPAELRPHLVAEGARIAWIRAGR